MAEFKKGDRVKVEYEGTVAHHGRAAVEISADGGWLYFAPSSALTLIERPVEPLAPGSVVRAGASGLWTVESDGRVFAYHNGRSARSSHNPKTLAEAVRDESNFTLIYDGSNK